MVRRVHPQWHEAGDRADPKLVRACYTVGPADGREAISLADAREKAIDVRKRARDGENPHFDEKAAKRRAAEAAVRERQEAQKAKAGTVAELAQQWLWARETKSWRPASRASITSLLNRHVIPSIGRIPAAEVTKADIRALLDRVHDRTAIGSNRAFEVVKAMYNWARSRDLLLDSPCDGVKELEKERQRERTFSDEQLRAVVAVVKGPDLEDLAAFLLRTGTRSHEARAEPREEIDFDRRVWTIPPENAKAGRKHEVPFRPALGRSSSAASRRMATRRPSSSRG